MVRVKTKRFLEFSCGKRIFAAGVVHEPRIAELLDFRRVAPIRLYDAVEDRSRQKKDGGGGDNQRTVSPAELDRPSD